MKKLMVYVLCLGFILGCASGCSQKPVDSSSSAEASSSPAVSPLDDAMLYDFEVGIADIFTQQDLSAYGVEPAPITIADSDTDTGKGLQVAVDQNASRYCQSLIAPMPAAFADHVADYSYLRLWVHNEGDSPLSVGVIFNAPGKTGSLDSSVAVVTRCDGEVLETATDDAAGSGKQDHVRLPAGFSGWIAYPLDKPALPILTAPVIADFAAVTEFKLDIRPSAAASTTRYVVDDICLTDSQKGATRVFTGYVSPTLAQVKKEVEDGLNACLSIQPAVKYYPAYDPKSSASGVNQWEGIRALTFDGAPINGSKTKVFAYIGYPKDTSKKSPAIVLLHGGMGHAYAQWIQKWTEKGYVAIAFDNTGYFPTAAGKGLAGRESDPQSYWTYGLSGDFAEEGYVNAPTNSGMADAGIKSEKQWMYHAVAQTILAHNILRADPKVDPGRIGITGISWGGVITSLAIGYDTRFAFAIPIYGSGYLEEALSYMGPPFNTAECRAVWSAQERFDRVKFPVFWMGWNNDTAFSINSNSKSYLDTRGNAKTALAMLHQMGHSHSAAWNQAISYRYADWAVKNGAGLIQLESEPAGEKISIKFTCPSDARAVQAKIYYVTEKITYNKKQGQATTSMDQTWQTAACSVTGNTISGTVPDGAHSYYIELTLDTPQGSFCTTSSLVTLS